MGKIVSTLETNANKVEGLAFPFKKAVRANSDKILNGKMICIDPGSVRPGWATYVSGALTGYGYIETESKHLHHRLQEIAEAVGILTAGMDLLVIENIGKPNENTIMKAYMPLLKSIGTILSASSCHYMIEIMPRTWQLFKDDSYVKDDDIDAMMLGKALTIIASEIVTADAMYATAEKATGTDGK